MTQFVLTCGEFGGSIHIEKFEQEANIWIVDGKSRVDLISKIACYLPRSRIKATM